MITKLKYLACMLSDKEIFANWLKKNVKLNGIVKGNVLAKKIGVDPSTISGWFGGTRSKGPEKTLSLKIIEVLNNECGTDFNYDEIIKTGRYQSEKKDPELAGEDIKAIIDGRVNEKLAELTQKPDNILMFRSETEREHFKIMQSFIDQETAKTFNEYLAELERLSVSEYELMLSTLKIKVKRLREKGQTDKSLGEEPLTGSRTG